MGGQDQAGVITRGVAGETADNWRLIRAETRPEEPAEPRTRQTDKQTANQTLVLDGKLEIALLKEI